jgi:ABC-type multidrug transport system fused ATPase/permease subunit
VESDNAEKIEEKKSEEYNISDDKAKKEAAKAPISNVFKIALRKWPYIILGVFSSILVGAVWPVYSFILSEMIVVFFLTDYDELRRKALQWMLAFFGLAGGMTILNFLCSYMYAKVGEYVTFELRSKVFSHILKQEIGWFELIENNPGILTTRLASDAEAIRSLAVDRSNVLVQTVVMIAIGIGIAFFNGWQLTLVVLGLAPLIGIAGFFQIKFIVSGAKKAKEAFETANALSAESIAQIRTVKSFNREETTIEKYTEALRFPLLQEARGAVISGLAPAFSNLATFGIYGVVFYIGAKFAEQGWITFDGILKVFFAIVISFLSAGQISQYAPDTSSAHLSVNAIFALLNRESKIDGTNEVDGEKHSLKEKDIVFNDVHFRYPSRPEVEVLKGLNIRVPAGKTVGLVGASGSGKSTIISILQRFYDFEAGQVYVGDTEVRNFNVKHLRGKIGVVSQEPVLFDGTIRENILYGRPEATESELEAAIQQSNVAPFLKNLEYKDDQGNIHKGLDALLGGEGIQLSGGQKQRVAIARAILKDPEILLLDEATSALDNESEKLVQESLEQLMKNRTTLIIAHRLSTIRNADWIIVMDGGKSVEQGTHDQLISQRGIYANLVRIGQKQ